MRYPSLNQETFEKFLALLSSNREEAGEKYELLRKRLITMFRHRRASMAEDMADETLDRVAGKLASKEDPNIGDPVRYSYGVAKNVFIEWTRGPKFLEISESIAETSSGRENEDEDYYTCMKKCLDQEIPELRDLIIEYYSNSGRRMRENRKKLANSLGVADNVLRVRIHRIKQTLEKCLRNCLNKPK